MRLKSTPLFTRWTSLVVLTWRDWNNRRDLNVHVLCRCPRKLTSDETKTHREGEKVRRGEGEEEEGRERERWGWGGEAGTVKADSLLPVKATNPPCVAMATCSRYPLFSELPLILAAFQSAGHVGVCAFVCWLLNESGKWKGEHLESQVRSFFNLSYLTSFFPLSSSFCCINEKLNKLVLFCPIIVTRRFEVDQISVHVKNKTFEAKTEHTICLRE